MAEVVDAQRVVASRSRKDIGSLDKAMMAVKTETACGFAVSDHDMRVGCWLLVVGCRLLVVEYPGWQRRIR